MFFSQKLPFTPVWKRPKVRGEREGWGEKGVRREGRAGRREEEEEEKKKGKREGGGAG